MASRYQNGLAQSLNSSFLWLAVDEILSFLLPFSLLFSLYLSKGAEKKDNEMKYRKANKNLVLFDWTLQANAMYTFIFYMQAAAASIP